jgi:hypothetical protein
MRHPTQGYLILPAIDLRTSKCVRLKLGEMSQATVFNDDPAAQARASKSGVRLPHIVDLNGAFAGKPVNGARSSDPRCDLHPRPARRRHTATHGDDRDLAR